MTPLTLSTVWYRRFYEAALLISLSIVALFVSSFFLDLADSLSLGLLTGIGGTLALIASAVCLGFVKKLGTSFLPSLGVFAILLLTTAGIIWETGGTSSPFIALWALLAFIAPIYGAIGWVSILVLSGVAGGFIYVHDGALTANSMVVVLASILPVIGGVLVWREQQEATDEAARNAKNLATELSEVATKSEIIINAIGDGVIAIDSKGTIELINPAAQEILGWGKQDALMLHYKSILKLNDENNHELEDAKDPIQAVLNTNQQMRANKLTAVTKSGKRINISLVVSPIGDAGAGVIAVFRDMTKERAEEREQAEFISTASHEMRTPVASIEGYLGLAMNPNTATIDDKARGFIIKAHESAQHLGRLFQDLLDVSKSEDGRMANLPKVVDMTNLTETVTQGLTQKAQEKGLRLFFKPNENEGQKKIMPVLYVNQDNDHIREILDNLVENAIKYTPKGTVSVDIEGTDDKVIVSVKDSGLGIPAEDIPHLFQKFYRVDNKDRQDIGGTGLGLYLSRRLAEGMQGRLWVESVYGQGSTFFLELPRIDSSEADRLKDQQASQLSAPVAPVQDSAPEFVPDMTPVSESESAAQSPTPVAQPSVPRTDTPASEHVARPATTVPRGESLTREQIAERVRQLEELAKQQREAPPTRPES